MFENIGGKIKGLSKSLCWIGIIASVISGVIIMAVGEAGGDLVGFLIMILGSLFSWIGSFMSYGFGQLIENTDILVAEKNAKKSKPAISNEEANDKINVLNNWKERGLITEEEYIKKMENLK